MFSKEMYTLKWQGDLMVNDLLCISFHAVARFHRQTVAWEVKVGGGEVEVPLLLWEEGDWC